MKNLSEEADPRSAIREEWSRSIQRGRLMMKLTQGDLARRAGVTVTTIYRAERGLPVRESSLRKLCAAMAIKFDEFLKMKPIFDTRREPYVRHRSEENYWYAPVDHRRLVPEDDQRLVQDPRERMRLGRLGLVPVFISYPRLIMPEGPGATLIELYGRYEDDLNSYVYRDCMMYCQRGGVRLCIRDEVVELEEGDFIGFASRDLVWMEPLSAELGHAPPPLALWLGAVRLGKIVAPPGQRTIGRKPRGSS